MVWMAPAGSMTGASPAIAEGIMSDTAIATPQGWRQAASLMPGDEVLTFDNGVRPVAASAIHALSPDGGGHWPMCVPPWALDNRDEVLLLPEQKVLIEADVAEELFGEAFVLVPAQALQGWRGIDRARPPQGKAAVVLRFDEPQIVYASRGVLLSCPGEGLASPDWRDPGHQSCTLSQARHLIACIMAEEAGAALRKARQHSSGTLAP
jgi:hypothetical protein